MSRALPGPVGGDDGSFNYRLWRSDAFGFLSNLARVYGDVVGFHLGSTPCILVNGASEVRELMTRRETHLRKPEFVRDSNCGYWGDGLTTLEGEVWRERRHLLRSCFSSTMVATQRVVVKQCTIELLDTWKSDTVVDLYYGMRLLVARIALRTLLDADIEGYGTGEGRSGLVPEALAYGEERRSICSSDPTAPLWQVRPRAPSRMDEVVRIIDERLVSREPRRDVLSKLVGEEGSGAPALNREQIIDELMQMLFAGHLTIPQSLMDFWREADGYEGRARFEAEADSYGQRHPSGAVSREDSLCMAMLKESLRLHPPAPILYREVDTAFELSSFRFERGSSVWVCPQLLHRDERYHAHPEHFLPQRFLVGGEAGSLAGLEGHCKASHQMSSTAPFLPFGMGPRTCVASHLAMQQMSQIALLVSSRFRVQPVSRSSKMFHLLARVAPASTH